MKIVDISISQPVFIAMLMLALIVVGYIGYTQMPVDLMPDFAPPYVTIVTAYPGASPSEVENDVSKPLEEAVASLNGVKNVTSSSNENVSQLLIEFNLGVDAAQAAQDVRERVATIRSSFPIDVKDPVIVRYDTSQAPVLSLGISDGSGKMSADALRRLVDDKLQPRLNRLDGVADVKISGGLVRQIRVDLNLDKIRDLHVAPQQVTAALQLENVNIPNGTVTEGARDLTIRTPGYFSSVKEIQNVVVANPRNVPIHLGDVATVTDGFEDVDTYSRLDGQDTIAATIVKQSGANTAKVADSVKAELDSIRKDYPDLKITIANDQSTFVKDTTEVSIEDLILGGLFASLIVLIFFRDLRNTLVTVAGLPFIMVGSFAVMKVLNLGINLVTLMALAIAVGLVIDDAIVVRENIFRHMERGEAPKKAALNGTSEVALSVLAMTLTVLSVFLPFAFTGGLIGILARSFALTAAGAVTLSLIEAFTLAPMLSAHFFKQHKTKPGHESDQDTVRLGLFDRFYRRILGASLHHKVVTVFIAVVLLGSIVWVAQKMEMAFFPTLDTDYFTADLKMTSGTTLNQTDAVARQIESAMRAMPGVQDVFTLVGGSMGAEGASFTVKMRNSGLLTQAERDFREHFKNVPQLTFDFGTMSHLLAGSTGVLGRAIQVNVNTTAGTQEELDQVSQQVMDTIRDVPGLVDLDRTYTAGKPEMHIEVDRETAAQDGLSTGGIGSTLRTLINGSTVTRYREADNEADIVVRLRPQDRSRLNDILSLTVMSSSGQVIPLRNVAQFTSSTGASSLRRFNRQPQVAVSANYVGRSESAVLNDVNARIAQLRLPAVITITQGGQTTLMNESFGALFASLMLSVIFVYMVLASLFGSVTQPIVLMLALPLSLLGAFLGLLITHYVFDLTAMLGVIMLMGLVTKNSILLIDFANRLRAEGKATDEALLIAGPIRLRPILMTTMSLILGMVPVALGWGAGGTFRAPMAICIIGGLITSTLLTLVLVPAAYSILINMTERFSRAGKPNPQPAPLLPE